MANRRAQGDIRQFCHHGWPGLACAIIWQGFKDVTDSDLMAERFALRTCRECGWEQVAPHVEESPHPCECGGETCESVAEEVCLFWDGPWMAWMVDCLRGDDMYDILKGVLYDGTNEA